MTSTPDLSPSSFVRAFVERRGGLAERDAEGRLELALPPALATALELPELAPAVEVRLGAPALERVLAEARRGTSLAAASIEGLRLKTDGIARLIGERLRAGNARLRAGDVARARTATLALVLRYEAVSDEVRGGLLETAIDLGDLTRVPDLRERLGGLELGRPRGDAPGGAPGAKVARAVVRDALPRIDRAVRPFLESMERRLGRDAERVRGFYDGLLAELDDPRSPRFRRLEPDEATRRRAAERRAIEAERARRLEDAARRYAVRLDVRVAAALRLEHDEVLCRLELRRRERERHIRAAWSPLLKDVKPLVCERCLGETRVFEVCDDALHVLCGSCAARACPVCAGVRASRRPV